MKAVVATSAKRIPDRRGEAKRDDENFFYVACWEYQGSDEKAPVLLKEPLVYRNNQGTDS